MFKYLLAFALLMPLVGIVLVEGGEYAGTIGVIGFPAGATLAYSLYLAVIAIFAILAGGGRHPAHDVQQNQTPPITSSSVIAASQRLIAFQGAFFALFLFGFGAIHVWISSMPKGELRVSLGSFALVPNLMTKFILPALLAYLVLLYRRSDRSRPATWMVLLNLILSLLIGMSWGFKSTGLLMLTPAALVYFWSISFRKIALLSAAVFTMLYLNFYLFDAAHETHIEGEVLDFIVRRLTILQGDVAWYMWTLYQEGAQFLPYAPTLLAAFGDTALQFVGVSRNDEYQWMLTHYDWMITYLAGSSLEQIAGGHSIVGTPFSEGLIAGGPAGIATFAVIAGVLIGLNYRLLRASLIRGRNLLSALIATYFVFYTFPWLIGGAIVQLFHPSIIIGIVTTAIVHSIIFRKLVAESSKLGAAERFS